jgi:hypothetical protein
MTIDDPVIYPALTLDELHRQNAALRLRLELTLSALRDAAYKLTEASADLNDPEYLAEIGSVVDVAHGAIAVATGQSSDIPKKLLRQLSLQDRDLAKRLLVTP